MVVTFVMPGNDVIYFLTWKSYALFGICVLCGQLVADLTECLGLLTLHLLNI